MPTSVQPSVFLAVGDLHTGRIPPDRLEAVFSAASRRPHALFLASPGDITDAGLPEQFDTLQPYVDRLPFPFLATMGNHDYMTGPDAAARERFCRRMGVESPSYRRTAGDAPVLFLSSDGDVNGCEVNIRNALPLLQAALRGGDGPLIVFCHAPLTDTVACAPGRKCFLSTDPSFGLPQSEVVRNAVAETGRTVFWISGHVHAPLATDGLLHSERLGDAALHSISLSCPYYTGRDFNQDEPIALFHFTLTEESLTLRMENAERGTTLREAAWEFGGGRSGGTAHPPR
jgi:hypothetical protein